MLMFNKIKNIFNFKANKVVIVDNKNELFEKTAEIIFNDISQNLKNKYSIALSGGRTPGGIFDVLVKRYKDKINWKNINFFWTDERTVSPDHNDSNYKLAKEHLFDMVGAEKIYRIKGELPPVESAREYEFLIRDVFHLAEGEIPEFDMLLLGIGDDGHTASLFPGTTELEEKKSLVVAPYVSKFNDFRISLTFPVINNAKKRLFVVSGKEKHNVFIRGLKKRKNIKKIPLDYIENSNGKTIWVVDKDAYYGECK